MTAKAFAIGALTLATAWMIQGCGTTEGIAGRASATHGVLDTSFGTGGRKLLGFGSNLESGLNVRVQADGKILLTGLTGSSISVTRLNTDGSLDTSFDTDGQALVTLPTSSLHAGIALQSDGKIVLTGEYYDFGLSRWVAVVARLTSTGALDTSFDTDGLATTSVGTTSTYGISVAIQSDGKIVVGGQHDHAVTLSDFVVIRYNTDGSLDTTFDTDGIASFDGGSNYYDYVTAVVLKSDGKILLTAYNYSNSLLLLQLNSNGSKDTSFGTSGIATDTGISAHPAYALGAAVQSDGKVIVVGYGSNAHDTNKDQYIVRFTTTGAVDTTFGSSGRVQHAFGDSDDFATGVALQSDGRIVISGYFDNGSDYDFGILRLTASGALDTEFGESSDGRATVAGGLGNDYGNSLALQSDGGIIVAGHSNRNSTEYTPQYDYSLIRLVP